MARPIQTDVVVGWCATPGSIVVWAGESHPGPNPKPDVQVSKHPAFPMFLSDLQQSSLRDIPSRGPVGLSQSWLAESWRSN